MSTPAAGCWVLGWGEGFAAAVSRACKLQYAAAAGRALPTPPCPCPPPILYPVALSPPHRPPLLPAPCCAPSPRSGRRSDDKVARPGGQDGASADPTTKLWMGGIDGAASAETVRAVFGRWGCSWSGEIRAVAAAAWGWAPAPGAFRRQRLGVSWRMQGACVAGALPQKLAANCFLHIFLSSLLKVRPHL